MAFLSVTPPEPVTIDRAVSRTLLQFRQSPVFHALLAAFMAEVQALQEAARDVVRLRGPADAVGTQLEGLGRIVGQRRELVDYDAFVWFTPDVPRRGPDRAGVLAWVTNAPLGTALVMGDSQYRRFIEAKIARNHAHYGSVPEVLAAVTKAFGSGVRMRFNRISPMTVDVYVDGGVDDNTIALFDRVVDLPSADSVYWLPLAATVHVSQVIRETGGSSS